MSTNKPLKDRASKLSLTELFKTVCVDWLRERDGCDVRGELGVFSSAVVVWLGIQQRLKGNSLKDALASVVAELKAGALDKFITRPGYKLRDGTISLNTGGISRARDRLSSETVQELFDAATHNIEQSLGFTEDRRPIYILDGQVTAIARTSSNLDTFGPTGNGEGELHYPRIRIVAAHKLTSGLASEVAIGDWHESEVGLAGELLGAIPKGALLVADRGFYRPTFLDKAMSRGLDVLVRLKDPHGSKLLGSDEATVEKRITWETKTHREDGTKINLSGRIIKYTTAVPGFRSSVFYIFTTADELSLEEVAALYAKRVQIEVHIRHLKQTLKLFFVRAKKGENVRKEILLAYLTFNLIRAIMEQTAQSTGCPVERLSFTATVSLCNAYMGAFVDPKQNHAKLTQDFLDNMLQSKLPLRATHRFYPREIKYPRDRYKHAAVFQKSISSAEEGK